MQYIIMLQMRQGSFTLCFLFPLFSFRTFVFHSIIVFYTSQIHNTDRKEVEEENKSSCSVMIIIEAASPNQQQKRLNMTWCTDCSDDAMAIVRKSSPAPPTTEHTVADNESPIHNRVKACPSCGHQIKWQEKVQYIYAFVKDITVALNSICTMFVYIFSY